VPPNRPRLHALRRPAAKILPVQLLKITWRNAMNEDNDDRVRSSTSERINAEIDRKTDSNIAQYANLPPDAIHTRVSELDREWDVERVLEVNASTLAFIGLVLGVTVHAYWLFLTGIVLLFLFQHGVQGWCPPLPILRRIGIRTRGEIDREKYALLGCEVAVQRELSRVGERREAMRRGA
ncbi:MAG: hypothetical protein SV422_12675, partial [Pseudomonadota bacterium]|nr:hypothetical protein [Pseudomonadota bacterium]